MRKVLVALAIVAAVAGCGRDHHGATGGTGGIGGGVGGTGGMGATGGAGGEPIAMFGSDLETAFCTPRVACGAFFDLATCVAFENFAQGFSYRHVVASVGRGTIYYDPVAAAACIAALPQDCSITDADQSEALGDDGIWRAFEAIAPCTHVFVGKLPLGAACRISDLECAGSTFCFSATSCMGTCMAGDPLPTVIPIGEDCTNPTGPCMFPSTCQGTCTSRPGHLASCDPATQYPCGYLDDYCAVAPGATTPTCLPRLAAGTACALISDIAHPALDPCVQAAVCTNGVCVATPVLGGPCDSRCRGSSLTCTGNTCIVSPLPDNCPA